MTFDELETLYTEIDNHLAAEEFAARTIGDDTNEFKYALQREANDQCYFLFVFTKLEKRVTELLTDLVTSKTESTTGREQTAWSLLNKKRKLELMEKVSFFTQLGGTDYNLIYNYKKQRDTIAHGGFTAAIDIAQLFVDAKRLDVELAT